MQGAGYSIRIMASRCGMTPHTLRYYERVGLIQPVWRSRNGHRRYSAQDEEWLKFLSIPPGLVQVFLRDRISDAAPDGLLVFREGVEAVVLGLFFEQPIHGRHSTTAS